MASEKVTHLSAGTFAGEVADGTVLVDFWASWCGPCRMLGPVIDEIAEETPDVKVCKLDVDAEGPIAAQYGVMSIPTVIVFRDGEESARFVGVQPKETLLEALA
ncbi:MAG: thioredoxin [Oscillospiraceae bacterium]|jgi:thioredoxin 1|nr:thioredoxin [Oscillospiraceae bacterium]